MNKKDIYFWEEEDDNSTVNNSLTNSGDIMFAEDEVDAVDTEEPKKAWFWDSIALEDITSGETEWTEESVTDTNEEWETLDLQELLDSLDAEILSSNENLDKIEEATSWEVSWELWMLRDSLKKMEDQLKKVNNEKMDLKFRNAELEAFWMEWQDPKILSLSRYYSKAKEDDKAKDKSVKLLKEMLYDLTWDDFDESKINSDIDLITKSELYNNQTNPNLKWAKEEDDWFAL